MCDAMRGNFVRDRDTLHPAVRVDRVTRFKDGFEASCYAPTKFHDPEGDLREAVGADLS